MVLENRLHALVCDDSQTAANNTAKTHLQRYGMKVGKSALSWDHGTTLAWLWGQKGKEETENRSEKMR
jgi:hypothetical protein